MKAALALAHHCAIFLCCLGFEVADILTHPSNNPKLTYTHRNAIELIVDSLMTEESRVVTFHHLNCILAQSDCERKFMNKCVL